MTSPNPTKFLRMEYEERLERDMRDLGALLSPRSIAVVGASERGGAGTFVIENLRRLGFEGKIIPINPRYETVYGMPCYPSLLDLPENEKVDSVAIVLGAPHVLSVLEQAAKRKVRGAWAFASGFAETGKEGEALQEALRAVCREHDILFCGPNCVGYANLAARVSMFSAPLSPTLKAGKVSAVAQSGSVTLAVANSNRGIGYRLLISSGNEAVLDTADYLDYLIDDPHTEVIILFLEVIRRPEAFLQVCERAAEFGKPIIAVKVGRSRLAQEAALSHTGALTGEDRIQDAWLKKAGVLRVDDLDQLLETAEAFSRYRDRLPRGNGVGMITVSGGEIGLIGDLSENLSLRFPPLSKRGEEELKRRLPPFTPIANPLDAWGRGDLAETYPACLDVLAREEGMDLIAVSQDAPPGMAEDQINQYAHVARAAVRASSHGKPVIAFSHISGGLDATIRGILEEGNIPFLQGTRESLIAMDRLVQYGKFLERRASPKALYGQSPQEVGQIIRQLSGPKRILSHREAKAVLENYGIPLAKEFLCQSMDEALEAAERLTYPVVLKGLSSAIAHKTEAGLVKLSVGNEQELRSAFFEVLEKVRSQGLESSFEGILVQERVSSEAIEVIVGISRDKTFGPALVLGLGGLFVELLKDTVIRIPPISRNDAHSMISELKGHELFQSFRGKPRSDVEALAETLVQAGQMAVDLREGLHALDLNPLMVLPEGKGVCAVDVVMVVGDG